MSRRLLGGTSLVLLAALAGFAGAWLFVRYDAASPRRQVNVDSVAVAATAVPTPPRLEPAPPGRPRRVILVIGDGMGLAAIAAARLALHGPDGRLFLERLPATALVATHSHDNLVTKSDSAATALATGRKTNNGRVGVDAEGRPLRSLLEAARDAGLGTGLVTNAEIYDATPAGFAAHVASRDEYAVIAEQLLSARVDVLLGGGAAAFLPTAAGGLRTDGRDLLAEAAAGGWRVVRDRGALLAAPTESGSRLLGVFSAGPIPVGEGQPSLRELGEAALAALTTQDRGFFLLLESERTDAAAHANDISAEVAAVGELDEAVASAVAFAQRAGDTLVLVTADHETGGLVLDHGTDGQLHVLWANRFHSAVPVPLFAWGPGAERFAGLMDNTEIPGVLAELLALPFLPDG